MKFISIYLERAYKRILSFVCRYITGGGVVIRGRLW